MSFASPSRVVDNSYYIRCGSGWVAWDGTVRPSARDADIASYPDLDEAKIKAISACLEAQQSASVVAWPTGCGPSGVLTSFFVVWTVEA